MEKFFIFFIFFTFAGCNAQRAPDESPLPWNRPAPWELRRDVSTSLQFHKSYKPAISSKTQ
ncbi:MAG: hypothetical protein LBJ81_01260 [Puniceicoccales bacterium]|nr:hypothetical protein [Puniceicoccales bacterium]